MNGKESSGPVTVGTNLRIPRVEQLTRHTNRGSVALVVLFSVAIIGVRNPLSPLGVSLADHRLVLWPALGLGAVILFACFVKKEEWVPLSRGENIIVFAFVGLFVVLSTFSIFHPDGIQVDLLESHLGTLFLGLGLILARIFFRDTSLSLLWTFVVALVLLLGIDALAEGPTGDQFHFSGFDMGRIQFGRFMAIGAIIAGMISISSSQKWGKIGLVCLAVSFASLAALSGSRGVVLALLLVGIAFGAIFGHLLRLVALSGLFAIGLLLLSWGPFNVPILEIRYSPSSLLSLTGRREIWSSKFQGFVDNPLQLFSGSFSANTPHSHNLLLETLVQGGILGLSFIVLVLVSSWRAIILSDVRGGTSPGPLLYGFMLLSAQLSGTFHENRLIWYFMFLAIFWPGKSENPHRARGFDPPAPQGKSGTSRSNDEPHLPSATAAS